MTPNLSTMIAFVLFGLLSAAVIVFVLFPGLLFVAVRSLDRLRAGWKEHIVQIENRPVFYLDSGPKDASSEVLLFVHGFGGDRDNWNRIAAPLRRNYRLVAVDLPGFGASPLPDASEAVLSRQLMRLRAFLDELQIERVHLVGCSMGAQLALHFAATDQQRVHSLVLFDPSGVEEARQTEHFQLLAQGVNCLAPTNLQENRRMFAMLFTKPPFLPRRVMDYLGRSTIGRVDFYREAWQVVFHDSYEPLEPILPILAQLNLPMQIYWGEDDRIVGAQSLSVFRQALPSAETHLIRACGHMPFLERPKEMARLVRPFLRSVKEAGSNG